MTIKSMFRVTYDSEERGGVFTVHTGKGKAEFIHHPKSLNYLDLDKCDVSELLINEENNEGHTKYEVLKAEEAWRLQNLMRSPSQRDFEGMVHHNLIKNCLVDQNDVTNVCKIFGPELAGVRGKTMQKKPKRVITDYVDIPMEIRKILNRITLTGDVMSVNKLPFFATNGEDIGLIRMEFTPNSWQRIWHMQWSCIGEQGFM